MKQYSVLLKTNALSAGSFLLLVFLSACYQTEEIRPLLYEPYGDPILPIGRYQAIDKNVEASAFQMIIRNVDPTGHKFLVSNFANLRIDVQMQATEKAFDLVPQHFGLHQGSTNVLLSGSMRYVDEHEYTLTYRVLENGDEVNRVLSVTFIGPCK